MFSKRARYFDGSPSEPATECDDGAKKRNMFDDKVGPSLASPDVSKEGPSISTIKAFDQSQNGCVIPEGEREAVSSDEQKALLHSSLQLEMMRLCQVLKFSDAVTGIALRFLEYVIKNRDINSRSQSILQALQISLCWIGASITKTKIDKKDSLMLAKLLLNYRCSEEQAHSVYIILKEMYSQCPEKIVDSDRYFSLDKEGTPKEKAALNKNVKTRMKRLAQKQQVQRRELTRNWEAERLKLVTDHNVLSSFVRSIHGQSSVGIDKIKVLENDLDVKVSELNLRKGVELKNLEARQLADIAEEERKIAQWQPEAKTPETVNVLELLGPQPMEQVVESSQPSETHVENSVTVSSQNELKGSIKNDVAILANPPGFVELVPVDIERNGSEKVSDKGLKSASPNEVVSSVDLHCPKLPSLHSEQTPDHCDLSPQKGLDEITVEKTSTLQTEAEAMDILCLVPSIHEAPVTEETVTLVQSINEAPMTDKTITSMISAARGQSAELSATSWNDVTIQSQVMMSAAERPNQFVLQPGIDPSCLQLPSCQPIFCSLRLLADPLEYELDNRRREAEQLENNQKNLISKLCSERDKEMNETISQIRKKYELKYQERDTEYQLKKQELDKNQKIVLMNKMLAMDFRSMCSYPEMKQVAPSSFVQSTHQLSMMPSVGPPPGFSPSQAAPTLPVATQSVPTMQPHHLSRTHPFTRSPTFINQSIPTVRSPTFANQSISAVRSPTAINRSVPYPLQSMQDTAALFSTITPSCNTHSADPHLRALHQSSRPPATTSAPALHLRAPHRLHSHALPLSASTNSLVSQNRAGAPPQCLPNNSRPYVPAAVNRLSSNLPELRSTFGSLNPR